MGLWIEDRGMGVCDTVGSVITRRYLRNGVEMEKWSDSGKVIMVSGESDNANRRKRYG